MASVMGLDMGAAFVKGVLIRADGAQFRHLQRSGRNYRETAVRVRDTLLENAGVAAARCSPVVVTGCGGECVAFATDREGVMRCLVQAISEQSEGPCLVLDLGARSSRIGKVTEKGRLERFGFSEKCASGSGTVLENISRVIQVPFFQMAALAAASTDPVKFTTGCAVFAETEAITAVARGERKEDIIAGFHRSIAAKLAAMVFKYMGGNLPVIATGGMALDHGLIKALSKGIDIPVTVPLNAQYQVALGAALLADQIRRNKE